MTDLTFVDELPGVERRRGGHSVTAERAAALKASPGQWARWPSKTGALGVKKALGPGFEAVLRRIDGKPTTFARFVGEAGHEPPRADRPLSPAPPEAPAQKVKCKGCGAFLPIKVGATANSTLDAHTIDNRVCGAITRQKR